MSSVSRAKNIFPRALAPAAVAANDEARSRNAGGKRGNGWRGRAPDFAVLSPAISEIGAALEPVINDLRNFLGRALRISALRQASLFASFVSNLA